MDRSPLNYALLYKAIKREIGFKWDETPNERFEDLCEFLQKRIDNTIVGKKQKSQGIKITVHMMNSRLRHAEQ